MNFINDLELAARFKSGAVPPRERFLYFISTALFSAIGGSAFLFQDSSGIPVNEFDVFLDITNVLIVFIGIIFCYRANQSGDGKEFIERMTCIGFPAMIQSFMVFLIAAAFYLLLIYIMGFNNDSEEITIYDLPPLIFLMLYYYWRLHKSIRIAAH
ncbi:hypothetical protein [Mesorhizobium sp. RMAD-H1]|uniref:hypothetical protein n=1 Tax=Mesorhizobium sp. RMAD-H1 TaxID=2587065 RepID=UPI001620CECA|nr:hypothetical protein [Mesorhizobium sp. RMAD-H1]MBB2971207.1 putative CDP-diglyceride synthetase/phosphatidate cytidylyltransferase [Mesorhizobium sp. RMAD-H1]